MSVWTKKMLMMANDEAHDVVDVVEAVAAAAAVDDADDGGGGGKVMNDVAVREDVADVENDDDLSD